MTFTLECMNIIYSILLLLFFIFFFTDPATTEIYTLSLHDALPISAIVYEDADLLVLNKPAGLAVHGGSGLDFGVIEADRKSTRLNSSHVRISYAVFCLKKKKKQ